MKKIIFLLSAILYAGIVFGLNGTGTFIDPYYGAIYDDITTFGPGTIYISNHIYINHHKLTIAPGTTLMIYNGVDIYVETGGELIANGTGNQQIIFTAYGTNWGHIYLTGSQCSFNYCIFEKGKPVTTNRGGAIYADGTTIYASSNIHIANSLFRYNEASYGGAITVALSQAEIVNCVFEKNTALRGSAIYLDGNTFTPLIDRCRIYSNNATDQTGASITFTTDAKGTIQNSLIYSNSAEYLGGGVSWGSSLESGILLNIINCVIANNSPHDVIFRGSSGFSVQNSIIWGSDKSVFFSGTIPEQDPRVFNLINCAAQGVYHNNIEVNLAIFTSSFKLNSQNDAADGPNFIYPLTNYNITSISPCRDKGISTGIPAAPLTDFLGKSRVGPYDIGAYEVQGQYTRWTGGESSDWSNNANWSSGVPGLSYDVAIFNAPNVPAITNTVSCNNLIIEPSASLNIAAGGALMVDGLLVINSSGINNNGSLINNGSVTGTVSYNRQLNASDYHYFSSPVVSNTFPTTGTVWRYNEETGTWEITTVCKSGVGYTLETGIGLLNFTGSLVTEDIDIRVTSPYGDVIGTDGNYYSRHFSGESTFYPLGHSNIVRSLANYGGGGWNLLGNPYTSALSVLAFINENNNTSPSQFDPNYVALYLYNGNTYNYVSSFSTGWPTGTALNESFIQVGQGFFVLAMNDNSTFKFKRSMQGHDTDVLLLKSAKVKNRWPGLQLKVKYGEKENLTTVVFNEEMSAGLDPGYDIGLMSSGSEVEIYTALEQDNGINFARQAIPLTNRDKNIIPVGIDTEKGGEVTFSADVEPLRDFKFLLEDRITGIFTNLHFNQYNVTLPAKTSGTGRFFIHIVSGRGSRQETEQSNQYYLRIWTSRNNIVNIQGTVSEKATCQVYDTRGHKIFEARLRGSDYNTFTLPSASNGVYMVKVMDVGKFYTTKVVFL